MSNGSVQLPLAELVASSSSWVREGGCASSTSPRQELSANDLKLLCVASFAKEMSFFTAERTLDGNPPVMLGCEAQVGKLNAARDDQELYVSDDKPLIAMVTRHRDALTR